MTVGGGVPFREGRGRGEGGGGGRGYLERWESTKLLEGLVKRGYRDGYEYRWASCVGVCVCGGGGAWGGGSGLRGCGGHCVVLLGLGYSLFQGRA